MGLLSDPAFWDIVIKPLLPEVALVVLSLLFIIHTITSPI